MWFFKNTPIYFIMNKVNKGNLNVEKKKTRMRLE